jgi:MFS family permease
LKDLTRRPSASWGLTSLSLAMLLPSLGTSIANAALSTLALALHASFQAVQWIVLAYLLASTTLIVSVGRLGDITGRRRLLMGGVALFTVASVGCGAAPGIWVLVAARAMQGLGAAVMMALSLAFVAETVPKAQTGRAMGLLGTMSALGTALGPSLGGVLIHAFGWRAIFVVNVPLGLLTLLFVARCLPIDQRVPGIERPKLDCLGTLLLAATLSAYCLAMTLGRRGSPGVLNLVLLLGACCGVAAFVRVERRAPSPLFQWSLFQHSSLTASLAMSTLVATVMMATLVVGPFYLSGGLGLEPIVVGLVLSAGPLVAVLTGVPAGRIADRLGGPRTTLGGLFAMAAGCSLLCVIPASLGIAGYVAPIALVTIGYVLFQTANNTAVMADVLPNVRGVVSGLLALSRNLGLISGASLMGAVFAAAAATTDLAGASSRAIESGMRVTFVVAAALVFAALGLAIREQVREGRRSAWDRVS